MNVALALVVLLAQERDVTIQKQETRKGETAFTFAHTFPDKTMMRGDLTWLRYDYAWMAKKLEFGPDLRNSRMPKMVPFEAGRRTAKLETELTPGFYSLQVVIDPEQQSSTTIAKALGDERISFSFTVFIGEPKAFLALMRDDTVDCAKMIREAEQFMKRIEQESDDQDWEKKSESLFQQIRKLQEEAQKKSDARPLSGTYQMVWQILDDLLKVGAHIGSLKMQAANGQNTNEDQDVPLEHTENGGDTPVIGDQGRKMLNVAQMKKNIRVAEEVRMREYFAWISRLHRHIIGRPDAASLNEELEKTYKHETKEVFREITAYEIGTEKFSYADFFALFKEFLADPELRAKIDEHLGVAQARAVVR